MTAAGGRSDGEPAEPEVTPPPPGFFAELAAAFRRNWPQGSAHWNFSGAFTKLDQRFGATPPGAAEHPLAPPADPDPPEHGARRSDDGPAAGRSAGPGPVRRAVDRHVSARLRPWLDERLAWPGGRTAEPESAAAVAMAEGFETTVEALRFLSARMDALEGAAARRREPIDALAWLVPPPALGAWTDPLVDWLAGASGVVLHGECGDGALTVALARSGMAVRGAEPRGAVAWQAAGRGVDVHVGQVAGLLGTLPTSSLGGLVLSGVVDRLPLEELVDLLAVATDRLVGGAPVAVMGTRPEAVATGWDAVARDLVPGRPLHPETWELLLTRAGYLEVGRLAGGPDPGATPAPAAPDTYVVKGRRPS